MKVAALMGFGMLCAVCAAASMAAGSRETEEYVHVPMPPHFRVEATELDGPRW